MAVLSTIDVDDVLAALKRDGFVIVEGAVPREPLAEFARHLSAEYDRAAAEGRMFAGGGSISGHLNCFPGESSRFIYDALTDQGILDLVRAFEPDAVDQLSVTTNFNLPGSHPQHFHSDGLYTEAFLICNVAVVDTDVRNGAIALIPGTHRPFYKFWQYATQRKYRESKQISMRAGDVLVRVSTLWHRGMPNHTSSPRPLMSLTFGECSAAVDLSTAFDGDVQFSPNWYGTSKTAQLRERIFVRAPWTYSTFRFVRSLVGNKGYSSW